MIKINLATKKQSVAVFETKSPSTGFNSNFSGINFDLVKGLPIRKVVVPLLIGVLASFFAEYTKEEDLKQLEVISTKLKAESNRLMAEINKYKSYESVKKSLDEDELTLKAKLEVIKKLLEDRNTSSKILLSISNSIPKDVWLTEFSLDKADIDFKGSSLGFNQVSDFMKSLGESAYFKDVELKNSQQMKDNSGLDVAGFELKSKRR